MKLYNADCLDILKSLPDKSVDLVVTDPPYLVGTEGGLSNSGSSMNNHLVHLKDSNIHEGYDIDVINTELVRVMKNINIYVFCNKAQILDYFNFYVVKLGCLFDILILHKANVTPLFNCRYLDDFEYCLYFHKGGYGVKPECYADASKYYNFAHNAAEKERYGHPTIKPLPFIERIIRNSSRHGDIVLDPYMGSGTTGVACKDLGRDFIGVEISEQWYKVAKRRIEDENATVDNSISLDLSQFV